MVGAATLKGQTAEQILAAKVNDKLVGSLDDPNKVFFFYNVKTGKFLSMGGYWGVHASLKDTPVPFGLRMAALYLQMPSTLPKT